MGRSDVLCAGTEDAEIISKNCNKQKKKQKSKCVSQIILYKHNNEIKNNRKKLPV